MSRRSISCNIAIIPPAPIARRAIALSQQLKDQGGRFVLDGKNYFPHVTLYMTEFPTKNLSKIKKALRHIIHGTHSFSLRAEKYQHHSDGYLDVHFSKNRALRLLHKNIVHALNPLRDGLMRPKDRKRLSGFTKTQQRNLLQYGYRDALRLFKPHLTFTKFFTNNMHPRMPKIAFSFSATLIGLFQSGKHGTCKKVFASFYLQ